VRGRTLQWTKDFLNNRLQQVLLDGHTSSTAEVLSGVPQGTVLGPLLFLTSGRSLMKVRKSSGPRTVPCGTPDNTSAVDEVWPSRKCVVIQISSKQSTIPANYTLHNHQLDVVDSSKYLGVTINKNLRWDDHITSAVDEVWPSRRTCCSLLLRKSLVHCRVHPRIP
jgi:hypothetical protein